MKKNIVPIIYILLGLFFTKEITFFDKLGIVEHKTIISDNTNNNGGNPVPRIKV